MWSTPWSDLRSVHTFCPCQARGQSYRCMGVIRHVSVAVLWIRFEWMCWRVICVKQIYVLRHDDKRFLSDLIWLGRHVVVTVLLSEVTYHWFITELFSVFWLPGMLVAAGHWTWLGDIATIGTSLLCRRIRWVGRTSKIRLWLLVLCSSWQDKTDSLDVWPVY